MALHAGNPRPRDTVLDLFGPSPGRLEFATRQALICALTLIVVELYQTPDAALTVYLVFFLNRPDRSASLVLNVILLVLITIVIGLVMLTAIVVIDLTIWRVASIATLSVGLLFLTSASKLRPVGSIVALIVGYGLDFLSTFQAGEIVTRALLYAWLFAAIPAGVSIAVNLLIAPSPRRLAERALAHRLRVSAAMLRSADMSVQRTFKTLLTEGLGEIPAWLKLAGIERTSPRQDIVALRNAAHSTIAILLLVDLAAREPGMSLSAAVKERLITLLDQMAAILEGGGYPVDIRWPESEDEAGLAPMPAALLADFREALALFAETPQDPNPTISPRAKKSGGVFLPDAFTNPEHVQYALKTTASAMICYGLYSILDWPSIHTCFITCYIVALSTTAETVEKLTLRILGCLLGAGAGIAAIVFVIPPLTSIGALMVVVFIGGFVAAWIAGGGPRIGYAGFQIAFAFFICVVQGPSPSFDMATARDRVIGILIGNLVSYLVFVHIWPVTAARRVDPAIGAMLRTLGALVSAPGPTSRRELAANALAAHGAIERDLGLLAYEPRAIRPGTGWIGHRTQALDRIATLTGPLLLAADQAPKTASAFSPRLARLAARFSTAPTEVADHTRTAAEIGAVSSGVAMAMEALVNTHIETLERATADDVEMDRAVGRGPS